MTKAVLFAALLFAAPAWAADPQPGDPGKDVIYVPSPRATVEKMLAMAMVGPKDVVYDLGSGDGRIVIAAARLGARAHGIEYNPALVAVSRREAERAGVADRATFAEADLFASDFSQATVITMFLTSELILKLQPKLLALRPGTRIVSNTFPAIGWEPDDWFDQTPVTTDCDVWCSTLLWIVPAQVAGTWRLPYGALVTLNQKNQMLTGVLHSGGRLHELEGRVRGEEITFRAAGREYTGRLVDGVLKLR